MSTNVRAAIEALLECSCCKRWRSNS